MKNQIILFCLMIVSSSSVFSQVEQLQTSPISLPPIELLSHEGPFVNAINRPYEWQLNEREVFGQILQSERFRYATEGTFSLSNVDQLRALKDMLDIMPASRAMQNSLYDQPWIPEPCVTEAYNNPALRADMLGIDYKTPGLLYMAGKDMSYPFSVRVTDVCNATSTYAMVIDRYRKVGFGTTSPAAQYHFAIPNFQVGDNSTLLFKINNTTGQENLVLSRTGYDLFKVNRNGKVFAREFEITIATNTFPDYVFTKSYELQTLHEVDAFIQSNHHLPGIEPASHYEKEGTVNIGELQLKLLEKVEELTLYAIQQQKEIEALKAQLTNK